MMNCKSLDFADEPEYDYLISLIEDYAFSLKIDLYDNVYDWSVKSTTILNFANFYDFIENNDFNPFNDYGHFDIESNKENSK